MSDRKKYVVVGTGGRAVMYIDALAGKYRPHAQLAAFCDNSPTRMAYYNQHLVEKFRHPPVPTHRADQFEQMLDKVRPDAVIVTTPDYLHHAYAVRAMELGCDVIVEKPMTIDADKANAILHAVRRTGRRLRVTFNYRYAPHVTKVRELVMRGVIGQPLAVDFSWVLDTRHGAEYFHRWHREMDKSGGLLVHKATHHFDLVNWWINSRPESVFAQGELKYYGRKAAAERGEHYDYARYTGIPAAQNDPFGVFLDRDPLLKALYLDAEKDSGYIRDRNVFDPGITIYDTMNVMVRYQNGVMMNYSLVAYSPWEGFRVAITGTKGRIELYDKHGGHIIRGQSDEELAAEQAVGHEQSLRVFPMFGMPYTVDIPPADGGHGGADPQLLEQLFSPHPSVDRYHRAASHWDGAASLLVGICANESIRTRQLIRCEDMVPLNPVSRFVEAGIS